MGFMFFSEGSFTFIQVIFEGSLILYHEFSKASWVCTHRLHDLEFVISRSKKGWRPVASALLVGPRRKARKVVLSGEAPFTCKQWMCLLIQYIPSSRNCARKTGIGYCKRRKVSKPQMLKHTLGLQVVTFTDKTSCLSWQSDSYLWF